ncbi:MAG TPA: VCBS repeat-containing protein [Planctomycetota bacterium]|nr:VCBS repeat-containing protein [Planctomycetota bacterium]
MVTIDGGALRKHASSITFLVAACIAPSGAMQAQSVHPFAAPVSIAAFSLSSTVALVDVNRDGSPDVVAPGLFFGTLVSTLDEHGNALSLNCPGPGISPTPGAPTGATAIAMASGRIDADEFEDLVTVTASGAVHFHRNLGSTQLDQSHFAPDVFVDNFLSAFPVNPPFVNYVFPRAMVVDLDADGFQDVLIGGGPVDRWSGSTCPGFVGFYKGDGTGNFVTQRFPLPGSVIDMEIADLDNNGTPDCLVVLTETGSVGAFGYDLVHIALVGGSLVAMGTPQYIGAGRFTALEIADVTGDSNCDYVLAQTSPNGGTTTDAVYYFQGDGLGHVSSLAWGSMTLPANVSGINEFISSIQIADFDRDSHMDLAILRGFVLPPPVSSSAQPTFSNSEILIAMGTASGFGPFETIQVPGYTLFSSTYTQLFPLLPLLAEPESLRPIDLGRDSSIDFLVAGVRTNAPSSSTAIVTIRNTTPPVLGDARFEKVGDPSGGLAERPARIGFEGGRPCPGNANFACTIQNTRGGSVVGLMWSMFGQADLFSAYGLQLHIAPQVYGYAALTSGSQAHDGFYSYALPIPNQPVLVGDAGYFQYNYYDPTLDVFGGTQATGLWIGN